MERGDCGFIERRSLQIVAAKPPDAAVLTEISFAAKQHWGYPARWIELWREPLTITPVFLAANETHIATLREGGAVGFYSLTGSGECLQLEHLWVRPAAMGFGIGRALFVHAISRARSRGARTLLIESDPNAEGFYRRLGAQLSGTRRSEVEGEVRELPLLRFEIG